MKFTECIKRKKAEQDKPVEKIKKPKPFINFYKKKKERQTASVNIPPVPEEKLNKKSMKALSDYIKYLDKHDFSIKTVYTYQQDIMQWLKFIYHFQNNKPITNVGVAIGNFIDAEDLKVFLKYCLDHNNSPTRMNRRMTSISNIYAFMIKRGTYIGDTPTDEGKEYLSAVHKASKPEKPHDLNWEQVNRILKYVEKHPNQQYELLIKLAFSSLTDIRLLASLTFDDLELEDMCFYYETGDNRKNRKTTKVLFGTEVKNMLIEWKKLRDENNVNTNRVFLHQVRYDAWNNANRFALMKWIEEIGMKSIQIPLNSTDLIEAGKVYLRHKGMNEKYIDILENYQSKEKDTNFYKRMANSTTTIENVLRKCVG